MQAKGSVVLGARNWRLQRQVSKSPLLMPTEVPVASTPAQATLAPSSPRPSGSISAVTLLASSGDNDTSFGLPPQPPTSETEDVGDDISPVGFAVAYPPTGTEEAPPAEVACPQHRLPGFPPAATSGPDGGEHVSPDSPPALLEEETSALSGDEVEEEPATEGLPKSSQQGPGPASSGFSMRSSPSVNDNDCLIRGSPPPPTSPALAAALTCAHGIGGRLGTPLGSPYPAPGEGWVAARLASASARAAAARTAPRSTGGMKPSAPGSRLFPPFVSAGASGEAASSPVVFEMVRDAADDEEDVATAAAAAAAAGVDNGAAGMGAGWHGLMLYRWVGLP